MHDYLVMCSYVHQCYSPVSFDMAAAFLRDDTVDYRETTDIIRTVASLIPDYEGAGTDDSQDYYMPRSRFISEAIIRATSQRALQRVLLKFQRNVSSTIIPNFHVFKRHAYSADFAKRAFPQWQEGKDYYDQLVRNDSTYYLLQQAALYFLHKERYSEAFIYINRARHQAGPKVFSIKNSHAIILFEANIIHASNNGDGVLSSLDESMTILTDCYRADKRKRYHAISFARQAIRYHRIYANGQAAKYLGTAREWLREEAEKAEWQQGIRAVLREVESLTR